MLREFSAGGIVYFRCCPPKGNNKGIIPWEGRHPAACCGGLHKKEKKDILWLIRRPKGGGDYRGNLGWSFPKGLIDKKIKNKNEKGKMGEMETPEEAALREVAEEGGVKAKIIAKLPALKIFFTNPDDQKVTKLITYFVMEWLGDLKEGFGWETKEIKWVSKKGALKLLTYKNEQELLKQATEKVGGL